MTTQKTYQYDVVVCGGGLAGVCAAVSASKNGARTVLIECGGELGGDITKAIVPQILDAKDKGGTVREMLNFLESLDRTSVRKGPRYDQNGKKNKGPMVDLEYVKYYLDKICLEADVDVFYHSMMGSAICEGQTVSRIFVAGEFGSFSVEGKIFIDATGNGALGAACGCDFAFGDPADGLPQPCSSSMMVSGIDDDVAATDTNADKVALKEKLEAAGIKISAEWASLVKLPQEGCRILTFNNQYNVPIDDPKAFSDACRRARIECIEVAEKIKRLDGYQNMEVLSLSSHMGVREGRRLRGLYTLCFDDITTGSRFEDGICLVNFPIDVHKIAPHDSTDHKKGKRVQAYHIPYRSLVSLDCRNLLLAGRCISGDFYAHASYRVAGNVMPMGEAAGYAAALCIKENKQPSDIDGRHVRRYMESRGYSL
jgi:hypothetical protein